MPSINKGRTEAWTALAADPAVRAAERAIVSEADAVLADTLAISARVEARRRLARVLELKDQAARDPGSRAAYHRAADGLRNWAAGVYLASLREPPAQAESTVRRIPRAPAVKHKNTYTEESASIGRGVPRPPFPGQPRRRPFYAARPSQAQEGRRLVAEAPEATPRVTRRRLEPTGGCRRRAERRDSSGRVGAPAESAR